MSVCEPAKSESDPTVKTPGLFPGASVPDEATGLCDAGKLPARSGVTLPPGV